MEIDKQTYDEIAAQIHSDSSPVGIDAQKTHVLIIHMLQEIEARLKRVEEQVKDVVSR